MGLGGGWSVRQSLESTKRHQEVQSIVKNYIFFSLKTAKFFPESSNFIKSCWDLFETSLILLDFLYSSGWVRVAQVLEKQTYHSTYQHQFLESETHHQLIGALVQIGIDGGDLVSFWALVGSRNLYFQVNHYFFFPLFIVFHINNCIKSGDTLLELE